MKLLIKAACLVSCLAGSAYAAPPPPPRPPAMELPDEYRGFRPAMVYTQYDSWLKYHIADAVEMALQDLERSGLSDGYVAGADRYVNATPIRITGIPDWPVHASESVIEQVCLKDPEDDQQAFHARFSAAIQAGSDEATAILDERNNPECYWQYRISRFAPAGTNPDMLVRTIVEETYQYETFIDGLIDSGFSAGQALTREDDLSGIVPEAMPRLIDGTYVRVFDEQSCPGLLEALTTIEALNLGTLDIGGFGEDTEIQPAMPHSGAVRVEITGPQAGTDAVMQFQTRSGGIAADITNALWTGIEGCTPEIF